MKTLTKTQLAEREKLTDELTAAHQKLEAAVEAFNETVERAFASVQGAVDELNAKIQEARDWTGNIAGEIESYIADRSEKWQDGDTGQAYLEWQRAFEDADLDEVSIDAPEPIDVPNFDPQTLEQLPEDAGVIA